MHTQPLSFPIRLPDALQAEALRLLDTSRAAINQLLRELWPQLDRFATERTGPAWKQVERLLVRRNGHGSRQERCEMEQAGRILRAQASRKQVFHTILPLLSEGFIRPADGKRPAGKAYRRIREQVRALRAEQQEAGEEAEAYLAMTNLIEQACNYYLKTGAFPSTYEEVQAIPVQTVGQLTFAGDDGMQAGQTYRARLEVWRSCDRSTRAEEHQAFLALKLRAPDEQGVWTWGAWSPEIPLSAAVCASLEQGATPLAPTLREQRGADGSRLVVLDLILEVPIRRVPSLAEERRVLGFDWGVRSLITASVLETSPGEEPYHQVSRPVFLDTGGLDGRQARLRREIDRLKACRVRYAALCQAALAAHTEQQTRLSEDFARWDARVRAYEERISACWQKYARRNRELAHLAANLLVLLALLHDATSSVAKTWPRCAPRGAVVACADAGGTGATIPPCAGNCGACSAISAACWASVPDRWSRAGPPTPARAATSQPGPLPPRLRPTAARRSTGAPGCAVRTPPAHGPARAITPPASISLGSAWPCSSLLIGAHLLSPLP